MMRSGVVRSSRSESCPDGMMREDASEDALFSPLVEMLVRISDEEGVIMED